MKTRALFILSALMLAAAGCNSNKSKPQANYETITADPYQDSARAVELNKEAVELINKDKLGEAEQKLKDALAADLMCGLAHNNLGTIYYRQQKFYLAAWEFQYAVKLMPGRAEPKNNLAMVMEVVGKYEDSEKYYDQALNVEPDNSEIIGNLARLRIRKNDKGEKTRQLLQDVVFKDTRQQWVDWAKSILVKFNKPFNHQGEKSREN